MTGFLNKERYVRVRDVEIGRPGSYTDYEELALREGDPDWFDVLRSYVAGQWMHGRDTQSEKDKCDLIFFNSVHVLSWWEGTGVTITEELVSLSVETSGHMLVETLNTEWLIRSEDNWEELAEQERQDRIARNKEYLAEGRNVHKSDRS